MEGIDASEAMVERLRAKPGGDSIPVVIGDMAQVPATGPFSVVYLVFRTLFGLLSQARQAQCFRNVARPPGNCVNAAARVVISSLNPATTPPTFSR